MVSARMKAEQAQEVARKAAADAEVAMSTARQYSPTHSQPGAPTLPLHTPFHRITLHHITLELFYGGVMGRYTAIESLYTAYKTAEQLETVKKKINRKRHRRSQGVQ